MKDLKDLAALRKTVGSLHHSDVKSLKVSRTPLGKQDTNFKDVLVY